MTRLALGPSIQRRHRPMSSIVPVRVAPARPTKSPLKVISAKSDATGCQTGFFDRGGRSTWCEVSALRIWPNSWDKPAQPIPTRSARIKQRCERQNKTRREPEVITQRGFGSRSTLYTPPYICGDPLAQRGKDKCAVIAISAFLLHRGCQRRRWPLWAARLPGWPTSIWMMWRPSARRQSGGLHYIHHDKGIDLGPGWKITHKLDLLLGLDLSPHPAVCRQPLCVRFQNRAPPPATGACTPAQQQASDPDEKADRPRLDWPCPPDSPPPSGGMDLTE